MSDWRIVRIEWNVWDDKLDHMRWNMFEFRVPESVTLDDLMVLDQYEDAVEIKSAIVANFKGECQHGEVTGVSRPISGVYGKSFDLEDVTELYGDKWTL